MRILCLVLLGFSSFSYAGTTVIFGRNDQKATVLIQGLSGDVDAHGFFDVLNLPLNERTGKSTKTTRHFAEDGRRAFEITCVLSKILNASGSCVITFHVAEGVKIDSARREISFDVSDNEAQRLGQIFNLPASDGVFYSSRDGKFTVQYVGFGGLPQAMSMRYR